MDSTAVTSEDFGALSNPGPEDSGLYPIYAVNDLILEDKI